MCGRDGLRGSWDLRHHLTKDPELVTCLTCWGMWDVNREWYAKLTQKILAPAELYSRADTYLFEYPSMYPRLTGPSGHTFIVSTTEGMPGVQNHQFFGIELDYNEYTWSTDERNES